MTEEQKKQRESAILSDLRHPILSYVLIAVRNGCGTGTVVRLAKKHGLTRPRGPKRKG